ncbi:MAG: ABC transporter substrate-binding protein [Bacteroidetes bacterium]|nr:ABC transporter substrate-binding protein [Bacteroidota bacterium]MCL5025150.1 ABC transporter substrate-binding protein [Chloroflexota bacterium]
MKQTIGFVPSVVVVTIVALLLGACASPTPTAVSTKAPAAPTASSAPTAAPKGPSPSSSSAVTPAATAKPAAKIKRGGTVRGAGSSEFNGFDPHTSPVPDFYTGGMNALYDVLLNYEIRDGKFTLLPELAESWEFSNDGKQVTFKLRKGVKFQDGTDFNADIAKWNFDRMMTHPKAITKKTVGSVKEVKVQDPYTLVLTLKEPSASFLAQMTEAAQYPAGIVSKAAVEKYGDQFGLKPETTVGSGPFKLAEWVSGDHIKLVKNENYWDKGADGQPLPYVDGVLERFIADSKVAQVELKAGNIDFMIRVAPKDVPIVRADPNLVLHELPWNDAAKRMNFVPILEPWKDNVKLRQAVSYGLDRQAIANVMGLGIGKPLYSWFSSANIGYNPSLSKYDYQPDKSKQLLKDAGYPNGLEVTLTQIDRPEDRQLGEIMQSMLKNIGVEVKVDVLERLAHNAARLAGKLGFVTGNLNYYPDPAMFSVNVVTNGAANTFFYSNPELDKCFDEGDRALDSAKRQTIYEGCQKIMFEDALFLPLYAQQRFDATIKTLQGWQDNWSRPRFKLFWLDR